MKSRILFILIFICLLIIILPPVFSQDSYDMLIITNEEMLPIANIYTNFKNKKTAIRTKVITVEEIRALETGRDLPEKIRNFIRKENNNKKIQYVMLAGDVSRVPGRYIYNPDDYINLSWETRKKINNPKIISEIEKHINKIIYANNLASAYVITDYYYADITSDFDINNDNLFGQSNNFADLPEGGIKADVFVGRIPARNNEDLLTVFTKLMKFNPSSDRGVLFLNGICDTDRKKEEHFIDFFKKNLADFQIRLKIFSEIDNCLDPSIALEEFNRNHSIVFLSAHGMPFGVCLNSRNYAKAKSHSAHKKRETAISFDDYFQYQKFAEKIQKNLPLNKRGLIFDSDIIKLKNNYPYLLISTGCLTGMFDYPYGYSFSERFLMQPNGAIAVIGTSRLEFGEMSPKEGTYSKKGGGSEEIGMEILRKIYGKRISIGKAFYEAKEEYGKKYLNINEGQRRYVFGTNLFGDPSIEI